MLFNCVIWTFLIPRIIHRQETNDVHHDRDNLIEENKNGVIETTGDDNNGKSFWSGSSSVGLNCKLLSILVILGLNMLVIT